MGRSHRVFATLVVLCSAISVVPTATERVQLSNPRVNPVNGLAQADVLLTAPPLPKLGAVTGRIRVAFTFGDTEETVDFAVGAVNVKRTVNSTRPFPCNQALPLTVKVVEPAEVAGHSVSANLTRKCIGTQGTPDLTVVSVTRTDRAGLHTDAQYLQSPRETPIQITIKLKNIAKYAMAFNEQGGTPWSVQVTPGTPMQGEYAGTQTMRLALQPGQEHTLIVQPVALPCGKVSDVTVSVDHANVILESDEANNKKTFKVPGNRCQDAG